MAFESPKIADFQHSKKDLYLMVLNLDDRETEKKGLTIRYR